GDMLAQGKVELQDVIRDAEERVLGNEEAVIEEVLGHIRKLGKLNQQREALQAKIDAGGADAGLKKVQANLDKVKGEMQDVLAEIGINKKQIDYIARRLKWLIRRADKA